MNTFTQKFDPIRGKNEWVMQLENYDYLQEIARSAYGDMLHDTERNHKYYLAIKKAVSKMKQEGKTARVLDIGTGTGLLSMMAAVSGADSIYACEAFDPVATCAINVIRDNGFENKITIIPKRSTELTVGKDGDLPVKANILVTEVFDTELIGEGALGTFRHALKELLDGNCIVVPASATVYAQVVESELISSFNKVRPFHMDENHTISPPPEVEQCPGATAVHDVQMAEIPPESFHAVTNPVPVLHFDFTGKIPLVTDSCKTNQITVKRKGSCEIVFVWWELKMDKTGDVILSCAPPWAHPDSQNMQWRDHWMQAFYYLPRSLSVSEGDVIQLQSHHDEYSLWFNVSSALSTAVPVSHPVCQCMVHCSNSRTRIGMLNDPLRRKKQLEILRKVITPSSICLSVGNGSLLPLIAAKLGAKKVFVLEPEPSHYKIIEAFTQHNQVDSKIKIISKSVEDLISDDLEYEKVNVLLSEPYFSTGLLPWDSFMHFWHIRTVVDEFLDSSVQIIPQKATIKAVAVEFKDLWKIRAPVVQAEGFDLSAFDKMTQEAISMCDSPIEPQPLWEYPCKPLTTTIELLSFDSSELLNGEQQVSEMAGTWFSSEGQYHGLAAWVDYETEGVSITTGPLKPVVPGRKIMWDMYTRQGVHFMQPSVPVTSPEEQLLIHTISFSPATASLSFDCKISTQKFM